MKGVEAGAAPEAKRRMSQARHAARFGPMLPPKTLAGFVLAALALLLIAGLSYYNKQNQAQSEDRTAHTVEVLDQLTTLLSALKDAETGQRGFLLTNNESYLEPYLSAQETVTGTLERLQQLLTDNPEQEHRLVVLRQLALAKMEELQETIALKREGKDAEVLALVLSGQGKKAMDDIRALLAELVSVERSLLAERSLRLRQTTTFSTSITLVGSSLLLAFLALVGVMVSRDFRAQAIQAWLRTGQVALNARMQAGQRLEQLGHNILSLLAESLNAQVGALYLVQEDGQLQRFAGYALTPTEGPPLTLRPGEGLTGQAVKEGRILHIQQVPEGYLPVSSSLGKAPPRHLVIAPASVDGAVNAVVELGFFHDVHPSDLELLQRVSSSMGGAIRAARDRLRLEELLEETQRQGEELQTQQEELRVSNEELEEQSQLLEAQKESLTQAKEVLQQKAVELERVNQYKSEFLANMSHELRTPLNSSLILAQLLADNQHGNLTPEQVQFAQTICAAGNDLLLLINDILDLSKIEAGKMEVVAEVVPLARLTSSIKGIFEPLAKQKRLGFQVIVEEGTPATFETDPHRLSQILRNLISNALKFTEKGEVTLRISAAPERGVVFAVRDTGIGIRPQDQHLIFEAFRQADGSTHRKYGGTGLGLSISRELARLLGGTLQVRSQLGEGSTFTLTLQPLSGGASTPRVAAPERPVAPAQLLPPPPEVLAAPRVEDDSGKLQGSEPILLIIEDDARFAVILRDMARELHFQCLVAQTGQEGVSAALTYRPNAIILDMKLPDVSGLGVLEQLKSNGATRHIPVHTVSVEDFSQKARELGAVGHALKPIKREQLMATFQKLKARFSQSLRRVLVVEDDARQRESIRQLLAAQDVEILGVESAGEALRQLEATPFDCVVMDLNLPDVSGYEMLEKMAAQPDMPFPPVIVYTGRSLTADEEQRLRRFSHSIIIKDARSPERLLDEVTLFLHQVESTLSPERQSMLLRARDREAGLSGRTILVVEDDVRNIFALTSVLEPKGVSVRIARNGREALEALARGLTDSAQAVDLVLMDIMMPEMDGLTAMREIRKRPEWRKLPIIALTAKAMQDDQERCLEAGANDYIAKPLDVSKLLSLVRVWMPK